MDYLTPLQDFFETFTWDIESKYNSNEVTLIEKTLFFIKEEFDATLTEFYVIKTMDDNKTNGKNKTVDKNKEINKNRIKFLKGLNLHIERLKNLINTSNIDYIEIDSQLMEMHHIILEQYQKLRGIVWAEKHSKVVLSSNARKGGRFSSSIYASQKKQAEQIYAEFKSCYPELVEQFLKDNKKKKPKTILKNMLEKKITGTISDRTFERWSCNLLKNKGSLISDNNK